MKLVAYQITLNDPAGVPVQHHHVRVTRIQNGVGAVVCGPTRLHPEGDPAHLVCEVPHRSVDPEGYFVVEVFGPADPALWSPANYHTHFVLPRKAGGRIGFIMPGLKSPDHYAGENEKSGVLPIAQPLQVVDLRGQMPDPAGKSDFGAPILLDSRRVGVRVTNGQGAHVPGYAAQLAIHGWHWWSRRQPLDHTSVGHEFVLRRTETVTWVHLYRGGEAKVVTSARIGLGKRDVNVVFVLPDP